MHTNAKIGDYSILNTGAILEHDCLAGNGVHIMPGAVVGGNAIIGDYVSIGLNATIMPNVQIHDGAFIGAGAVVMDDVKKNEVVVGNPAKYLKKIEHKVNLDIFK
jgi:acetyltransferase-like isoleucine patch superfamily enzyme